KSVQEEMESLKKRGQSFANEITSGEVKSRVTTATGRAGNFIGDILRAFIKFFATIFGIIITLLSLAVLIGLSITIFSGIGVVNFVIPHTIVHMVISNNQIWWL